MTTTLSQLRGMGYDLEAAGEALAYRWTGPDDPPEEARMLLSELSNRKREALAVLRGESRPPKPWTWAGPDPDNPGLFIAWRSGEFDRLVGRGATELDAVMNLWDAEEALERARR